MGQESVLNLPAQAVATHQKYIRRCLLCGTGNHFANHSANFYNGDRATELHACKSKRDLV